MNLSSSSLQRHETNTDITFIQKRIHQMQQYLGISNEEIQYSQESLGQSARNNQLYMNRLIQIIEIKNKEQQLVKQRNDAVQYLNQCLDSNQGSRKGVIQALVTVKSATAELITILQQLRGIVHYPINFELQADLNQGTLYENLQLENWITLSDIIKLFLVVRVFDNSSHSEITQYLSDQGVVQTPDLTIQFFFNDQILPFVQFWLSCIEKHQQLFQQRINIPRLTYSDFLDILDREKEEIQLYNNSMQVSQLYGQVLCTVPTRLMKQGLDSYIANPNIQPQFIGLASSQFEQKSSQKDLSNSQCLNSTQLLHSNKQIQDIKNLEQQIEEFQANIDTDSTINEMQNKLNITQIEKEYATFCINNGQISKQKYYRKVKKVLSSIAQINLLEQKRKYLEQQVQQFIETGKGSKKSLLHLLQQLKQNIINMFCELNQFQQLIGYVINQNFKVQYIYNTIVNDFSDDLIILILKVMKYPLMNQSAEEFLLQVKKVIGKEFRVKLLFNVDLEGELKNFPTMFWYLIEKAYYKQNKKQLAFDYKITANEILGLCMNEVMNVNKLLMLNEHCVANNIWICKVPVLTDGRTDCYKCHSGMKFPGLDFELGFKKDEPDETALIGSTLQNASEDKIDYPPKAFESKQEQQQTETVEQPNNDYNAPPVYPNEIEIKESEQQEINITDTQNSIVHQDVLKSTSITTISSVSNNDQLDDQLTQSVQLLNSGINNQQINKEIITARQDNEEKFCVPTVNTINIQHDEEKEGKSDINDHYDQNQDDNNQKDDGKQEYIDDDVDINIEINDNNLKVENYEIIANMSDQQSQNENKEDKNDEPELEIDLGETPEQKEPNLNDYFVISQNCQEQIKQDEENKQDEPKQDNKNEDKQENDEVQQDPTKDVQEELPIDNKQDDEINDGLSSEYPEPPKHLNDDDIFSPQIETETQQLEDQIKQEDEAVEVEEPEVIQADNKDKENQDIKTETNEQPGEKETSDQSVLQNYAYVAEINKQEAETDTPPTQEKQEPEQINKNQKDNDSPEVDPPKSLANYNIINTALSGAQNSEDGDKSLSVSKD